jgi:hypothetical protein
VGNSSHEDLEGASREDLLEAIRHSWHIENYLRSEIVRLRQEVFHLEHPDYVRKEQ